MDFAFVFEYIVKEFKEEEINFAIIGGLALQSYGITRTTQDIDFLILAENKEKIKELMIKGGFNLLYESNDILNFVGNKPSLGRVDFLLAQRKYTFAMLKRAQEKDFLNGKLKAKFIKIEDQIGLKIQSSSNDPSRYYQDMADVENLIKNNVNTLDKELIREYFTLFNRETEFDKILDEC